MMKAEIDLVVSKMLETQVKIFLLVKIVILALNSLDNFSDIVITEKVFILPGPFEVMME